MKMVALLRGINVGGNKKVPMLDLCSLATKCGMVDVRSYIQSGNLVFDAGKEKADQVSALLEKAIEKYFKFQVDVIVRSATQWKNYSAGSPFSGAERSRPNLLMLGLSKNPCGKSAAAVLTERATQGEKIKIVDDAIWIDFGKGVAKSKITPALLEKAAGSVVTLRNWNTVLKLQEMLEA